MHIEVKLVFSLSFLVHPTWPSRDISVITAAPSNSPAKAFDAGGTKKGQTKCVHNHTARITYEEKMEVTSLRPEIRFHSPMLFIPT